MNGRCLIITTHYRPLVGGAQAVYDALAAQQPDRISVLTASRNYETGLIVEGAETFDTQAAYSITRMDLLRPVMLGPNPNLLTRVIGKLRAWRIERDVRSRVTELIDSGQFDAVCVGALDALGWLVEELKAAGRVKVYLYAHGEEISQKTIKVASDHQRRRALTAADGVIAVSSFTADLAKTRYGVASEKIKVITNGVDLNRYQPQEATAELDDIGIKRGQPLVLAVGRLVERKGFDNLLMAWPQVLAAVPDARLAIAGKGPLESTLKEMINSMGIADSVDMLGFVPDQMMPALFTAADVFAMPNRTMPDGDTEGFGLVFLEAAACGTPGVGGRAGGVVDAILDGETGYLVDGTNPGDIAGSVITVLKDKDKRTVLGQNARTYALTQGWQAKSVEFLEFMGLH